MDAEIPEKLLPKKFIKNTVLSTRLGAKKSIKIQSKFYQKSLTPAWDFFPFLEWKRLLFDTFSGSRLREISKTLKEKTPVFHEFSSSKVWERYWKGVFSSVEKNTSGDLWLGKSGSKKHPHESQLRNIIGGKGKLECKLENN